MKSINIKGKNYVMVNERISFFRTNEEYKGWSLTSEIINLTEDSCIIRAVVTDDKGVIRATGYAQEDRTSSMINKTSFVENCETSAWGRALGCLGIGIQDSIASAEEVDMVIDIAAVKDAIIAAKPRTLSVHAFLIFTPLYILFFTVPIYSFSTLSDERL